MKVVLLKSVDNLGQAGQVVEAKPGYYRNYLGPREMALPATSANLKVVESRKKKLEAVVAREITDAQAIKQRLDKLELTFHLRAGEMGRLYGSVTAKDLLERIKEVENIEIERRRVEMDNLKTLGKHHVRIRVYPGVTADVVVVVDKLRTSEDEAAEAAAAAPVAEEAPSPAAQWVEAQSFDEDEKD